VKVPSGTSTHCHDTTRDKAGFLIGYGLSASVPIKCQILETFPRYSYPLLRLALQSSLTMLNLSSRTANAVRALQRLAAGMATAAPRIGDTKVPMSLFEKSAFINYQRIEDNLAVIRKRFRSCPNHFAED
jgi:hypothetical protein